MKKVIFEGVATALVTPFKNGKVDFDNLGELIEFQIANKADAIVVCGTTGEAPTLEDNEHLDVIEYSVRKTAGRIPVIAGTGSNNTAHAVMMNIEAEKRGADGLLWVTPYYNKSTQRGLYEHYKTLAQSTSLPAILYNVPGRTGVNLLPETVYKLSEFENIVAVKEASGNIKQTVEIKRLCGDSMTVYSGDDDLIVPLMSVGAQGVISVLSNIAPKETHELCQLCFNGDYKSAATMQIKYSQLIKALFCEVNPIPVKAALKLMKLGNGEIRLPLYDMEDKNVEFLKECLIDTGLYTKE